MIRRNTDKKTAVLELLQQNKNALSQEEIQKKLLVSMDRATIYRVLNRFCEDRIAHKITADDGKQYFALCRNCTEKKLPDHHFHFRCLKCQSIECLAIAVHFSLPKAYELTDAHCLLTGHCADCSTSVSI